MPIFKRIDRYFVIENETVSSIAGIYDPIYCHYPNQEYSQQILLLSKPSSEHLWSYNTLRKNIFFGIEEYRIKYLIQDGTCILCKRQPKKILITTIFRSIYCWKMFAFSIRVLCSVPIGLSLTYITLAKQAIYEN